jgi:molybdenum cofactor synthesis domain-containing protein
MVDRVSSPIFSNAIQAAVVTISDRCAAGSMRDTAGPAVASILTLELGAQIAATRVLPDEAEEIAAELTDLCGETIDLVITVGGTGLSSRDVTPEATRSVLDREVPGLAEAMRAASARVTAHALLSRAVAGIRGQSLIVNLPGSLKAACENLRTILPALPHAVKMLRGDTEHSDQDAERSILPGASSAAKG